MDIWSDAIFKRKRGMDLWVFKSVDWFRINREPLHIGTRCLVLYFQVQGLEHILGHRYRGRIALMHVYVTQANFTTKPRFEIKNKRSFTEMNSQGSRVEKNTHAQKVQMQKILFTNEACW